MGKYVRPQHPPASPGFHARLPEAHGDGAPGWLREQRAKRILQPPLTRRRGSHERPCDVTYQLDLARTALEEANSATDEHCGPEVVLPLREPCRSVRADPLFGVTIALTALPLITLPVSFWLREAFDTDELAVYLEGDDGSISLRAMLLAL